VTPKDNSLAISLVVRPLLLPLLPLLGVLLLLVVVVVVGVSVCCGAMEYRCVLLRDLVNAADGGNDSEFVNCIAEERERVATIEDGIFIIVMVCLDRFGDGSNSFEAHCTAKSSINHFFVTTAAAAVV
jgi:hypothetical protein